MKHRSRIVREVLPDTKSPQSKDGFVFSSNIEDWQYSKMPFSKTRRRKQTPTI